jgi:hypothetical protein
MIISIMGSDTLYYTQAQGNRLSVPSCSDPCDEHDRLSVTGIEPEELGQHAEQ